MARYSPLITIGVVAALGGGLLYANSVATAPAPIPSAAPVAAVAGAADSPAAPAAPAPAAPAVAERAYTGRSAGNEVTVAIAVKDGRAVGYVCDGEEVEAWFEGTLAGPDLQLSGGGGAATIAATLTEDAVLGTVTVAGEERPFAAEGVAAPAGLYEGRANVDGVATRIGWIVDGEGEVTGVASARGARRPAPALDPADPDGARIDGVPVEVTPLGGGDRVIGR